MEHNHDNTPGHINLWIEPEGGDLHRIGCFDADPLDLATVLLDIEDDTIEDLEARLRFLIVMHDAVNVGIHGLMETIGILKDPEAIAALEASKGDLDNVPGNFTEVGTPDAEALRQAEIDQLDGTETVNLAEMQKRFEASPVYDQVNRFLDDPSAGVPVTRPARVTEALKSAADITIPDAQFL